MTLRLRWISNPLSPWYALARNSAWWPADDLFSPLKTLLFQRKINARQPWIIGLPTVFRRAQPWPGQVGQVMQVLKAYTSSYISILYITPVSVPILLTVEIRT